MKLWFGNDERLVRLPQINDVLLLVMEEMMFFLGAQGFALTLFWVPYLDAFVNRYA